MKPAQDSYGHEWKTKRCSTHSNNITLILLFLLDKLNIKQQDMKNSKKIYQQAKKLNSNYCLQQNSQRQRKNDLYLRYAAIFANHLRLMN